MAAQGGKRTKPSPPTQHIPRRPTHGRPIDVEALVIQIGLGFVIIFASLSGSGSGGSKWRRQSLRRAWSAVLFGCEFSACFFVRVGPSAANFFFPYMDFFVGRL